MIGKTAKITVYVLVMIFFASTIIPAVISENFMETTSETEPLFVFEQTNSDTRFDPFLVPEESTITVVVEMEDGGQLTMEIPEGLEGEALEDTIEERIENEPIEELGEMEEESPIEDDISETDDSLHVALHSNNYRYFLKGYFFCEIGQEINLEASDLYTYNTITRYEWDFNGDGTHDLVSSSPSIYHSYNEIGLYFMRVKITYSYNYTYYQYSNRIGDNGLVLFGDYDPGELATTVTKIYHVEYETRVSVGSEQTGYPPILDFDFRIKEEPEPTNVDEIDVQKQSASSFSNQPWPELAILDQAVIKLPAFEIDDPQYHVINIYNQSKTHVRMFQVTDDVVITHIPDCVIEFDASKTVNFKGKTEFYWDFGDGTNGNGDVVSHTYRRKGTYTATLHAEGWDYDHSATFVILRGYGDPRVAFLSNYYSDMEADYMFCRLGETLNFDMSSLVSLNNLAWIEWDFDYDGTYEENTTSPRIFKTFETAGYFEVRLKYTYKYESYNWYPITIWGSYPSAGIDKWAPVYYYHATEYTIKVAVANQDGIYPPIPDFYVKSSPSFSWWISTIDFQGGLSGIEIKNATYLHAFSESDIRLNSWNGSVSMSANTSFDLNTPKIDSFTYRWDFGDGTFGSGVEVSHIYTNSNIDYEVRLTVSNEIYKSSTFRVVRTRPLSPNIYLYREKPGFETVRVIVDGTVTKTVPEVELGSEITWENVWVEDGKLNYDGKSYDFLYYEELIDPKPSKFGWVLERDETGRLFLNNEKLTLDELKEFFRSELKKSGLYDHETEDFVEEWLGEGGRLFPGEMVFRYAIMYIPENIVDGIIQLETKKEYNEIIRVHFLVQPAGENLVLETPRYPKHAKGTNVLHEWGVYTDNTIVGEEDNPKEDPLGNSLEDQLHFNEEPIMDNTFYSAGHHWIAENRAEHLLDYTKSISYL